MLFLLSILTFVIILFFPKESFAWGLGVHLQLGIDILNNLSSIPSAIANIIYQFPYDYLYGCIGADITIGKRFIEYKYHCHNWNVGFSLFNEIKFTSQKSFVYGYLSHLAADVIAHNYYIPNQIIASFPTKTLKHIYWEMRFETYIKDNVWELAKKIVKREKEEGNINDELLSKVLKKTIFSFEINKKIFNGLLMLTSINQWQKAMQIIHGQSSWVLTRAEIEEYYNLSKNSIEALLSKFKKASCVKEDPTGNKKLKEAIIARKTLKRIFRHNNIEPYEFKALTFNIHNLLRDDFYNRLYGNYNIQGV